MTITAVTGPLIAFPDGSLSGSPANQNPEQGPSGFVGGTFLLDPRAPFTYQPGQDFGKQVSGWVSGSYQAINQVPSTATSNNIAAAQTATANTALTLRTTSQTGTTAGVSIVRADTGATVTGLLAIDGAMTTVRFGSAGTIQIWDPTKAVARNINILSTGTDQTGTFVVRGYDLYGFPMSETITGGNGTSSAGKKAFKYIASVTPAGTVTSTALTVGTGDIVGFPLRADFFGDTEIAFNSAWITASTGFTAAVTSTATSTSGDVRGTWIMTTTDGTKRLQLFVSPGAANLSSSTGIVGVAQFSA